MSIKDAFDKNDAFYSLKSRGLYDDAITAFDIEATANKLPNNQNTKNAYLLLLQSIADNFTVENNTLTLAQVVQTAPLKPVYLLRDHGQEQLDKLGGASSSLDDIITAAILSMPYRQNPDKRFTFIHLVGDNSVNILSECHFVQHDDHADSYTDISAEAKTLFIAHDIYNRDNLLTVLEHDPRKDHAQAAIQLYINGHDLQLGTDTALEKMFSERQRTMLTTAKSILKAPPPSHSEQPVLKLIK